LSQAEENEIAISNSQSTETGNNLRAAYAAVLNYHNSLVQARFTVAGLVIAANGFLVSAFFQVDVHAAFRFLVPFLGMLIASICWLLEVRTTQLLENLWEQGKKIEESLGLYMDRGFFYLMKNQYKNVRPRLLPFREDKLPEKCNLDCLVSHSVGLGLLYIVLSLFWLTMLFMFLVGA
jgi:uncharacterized membrane protein